MGTHTNNFVIYSNPRLTIAPPASYTHARRSSVFDALVLHAAAAVGPANEREGERAPPYVPLCSRHPPWPGANKTQRQRHIWGVSKTPPKGFKNPH